MERDSERFQRLADEAATHGDSDTRKYWQGLAASAQFVELWNEGVREERQREKERASEPLIEFNRRMYDRHYGYPDSDGCD